MESLNLQTYSFEFLNQNQICHITINRPKKLNAMNEDFFTEIPKIFQTLDKQSDLRCVIITANGKYFTAGLDLQYAQTIAPQADDAARNAMINMQTIKWMQGCLNQLEDCRVPVLVGIHGLCIGGGIDFILASDIRYCTIDTEFSIKEIDIGMAADLGTLQRFPLKCTNDSVFRELTYTGRRFSSQEALQIGLVSKILQNKDEMMIQLIETAKQICSKSPVGIWANKHVLNHDFKKRINDNLAYIQTINGSMLQTADMAQAVLASLSKYPTKFPKL